MTNGDSGPAAMARGERSDRLTKGSNSARAGPVCFWAAAIPRLVRPSLQGFRKESAGLVPSLRARHGSRMAVSEVLTD